MLSGMEAGERHHTFTESHILPIDEFMRWIYVESVCEIAANEIASDNIVKNIRFICVIQFCEIRNNNQIMYMVAEQSINRRLFIIFI